MARKSKKQKQTQARAHSKPFISEHELAQLGDGICAYVRTMTGAQARRLFPQVQGLPRRGKLFALYHADGTPIAITDSHEAACVHAYAGELEISSVH